MTETQARIGRYTRRNVHDSLGNDPFVIRMKHDVALMRGDIGARFARQQPQL
jgi:hypothetical protein